MQAAASAKVDELQRRVTEMSTRMTKAHIVMKKQKDKIAELEAPNDSAVNLVCSICGAVFVRMCVFPVQVTSGCFISDLPHQEVLFDLIWSTPQPCMGRLEAFHLLFIIT